MFILLCMIALQEAYYVDGTEFILNDGTRILTLSDVKTDLYSYYWYEDGVYITINKNIIIKVDYFSFREIGRKPKAKTKNIHQRRIRGKPVLFHRGSDEFLRVLHVNAKGRSIEGQLAINKVVSLKVNKDDGEYMMAFSLEMCKPDYMMEFHFYDMKGKRVATSLVDLEMFPRSRKQIKKGLCDGFFHLPGHLKPQTFGLVEVASSPKQGAANE